MYWSKGAYTYARTFMQRKVRTCGKTDGWSMVFSPTYLNLWFWSLVLHLNVEPKYWVPSISSQWFWTMVWVRPKIIKAEGDHLARVWTYVLNILRRARSGILVIGWWVTTGFESRRNLSSTWWLRSIDGSRSQGLNSSIIVWFWSIIFGAWLNL